MVAERAFYDELFRRKPDNEHITEGYDEIHSWAFSEDPEGIVLDLGCGTGGTRYGWPTEATPSTLPSPG